MADYLNEEQRAKLMEQLGGSSAPAPEEESAGAPEGAPVDDMGGGAPAVDAAPAPMPAGMPNPGPDPNALANELGFETIEDLVNGYKDLQGQHGQYRDMLTQLLAFQQALDNNKELDPKDPMSSVKKAVREEMAPVYEKLQQDAKNKLVQEAWGKDAKNLSGLTDMMPEITMYLSEHPELSVANDGLKRAYEGVRSSKYRTESELFADNAFVERASQNEKIKDAVIKEYLAKTAKQGEDVPPSIAGGGNVPLTGKKQAPSSMDQAKSGLAKMLGMK